MDAWGESGAQLVGAARAHRWEIKTGWRERDKIGFKVRRRSFLLFDLRHFVDSSRALSCLREHFVLFW